MTVYRQVELFGGECTQVLHQLKLPFQLRRRVRISDDLLQRLLMRENLVLSSNGLSVKLHRFATAEEQRGQKQYGCKKNSSHEPFFVLCHRALSVIRLARFGKPGIKFPVT